MTAWMNFKIGCCETIFVRLSCLIYDVNSYWKGKLSFCYAYKCLHCLNLQFSKVFSVVKNVWKLGKSHLCQAIKEKNIRGILSSLHLFVTFKHFSSLHTKSLQLSTVVLSSG